MPKYLLSWQIQAAASCTVFAVCSATDVPLMCRPANVQIGEIVSFATTQASPWNVARPLADKSKA